MHPVAFASGHQLQTEDICFVLLIQQAELVKVPRKIINFKYEYSYIGTYLLVEKKWHYIIIWLLIVCTLVVNSCEVQCITFNCAASIKCVGNQDVIKLHVMV